NNYVASTNVRWVHNFLLRIGFPKGRKLVNAEIPPLFRESLDVVRGLFDTEGYVGVDVQRHGEREYRYPYVGFDAIARPLVVQSHHILSANGIQSTYSLKRPHAWGKHQQWRLQVKGWENVELFREKVGFRHPVKAARIEQILREGGILRDHTPRTRQG
ncbi:MAG: LAGLIDADG family homing endonuclease, partial [Candidatus Nitrosocaldus sp.]|nr:LAGLIDADG family homing endonuclease [Candidatus Nitrosocaldus sp.]